MSGERMRSLVDLIPNRTTAGQSPAPFAVSESVPENF